MSALDIPDAEAVLAALAAKMRDVVAHDAAFVGIYSGGAWLAERLAAMLPGQHPVGFVDVSYYRDDYAKSGLKGGARRT
ncbi:MAG TPA: bifunctional pyr operon transcriptional regulator/uracil phosphoribosyltransferase PyrR, partial [Casimicrobiaceae bacterium]|nr:bifunctional pyr operon transcriptional regulator/uracil phosphoribosyltransferase PyrR [Casimicrobiaceae bacterium]